MSVKLLIKHYLEFLSLKGGCTGLPESIHDKIPHRWKSHAAAHILLGVANILQCAGYINDAIVTLSYGLQIFPYLMRR